MKKNEKTSFFLQKSAPLKTLLMSVLVHILYKNARGVFSVNARLRGPFLAKKVYKNVSKFVPFWSSRETNTLFKLWPIFEPKSQLGKISTDAFFLKNMFQKVRFLGVQKTVHLMEVLQVVSRKIYELNYSRWKNSKRVFFCMFFTHLYTFLTKKKLKFSRGLPKNVFLS